ncbi:MAG: hypothetical protein IPL26_09780 [Leptospiraceae bacterium]|nr:hypothetical protein [Leptospiraceae bacterium]
MKKMVMIFSLVFLIFNCCKDYEKKICSAGRQLIGEKCVRDEIVDLTYCLENRGKEIFSKSTTRIGIYSEFKNKIFNFENSLEYKNEFIKIIKPNENERKIIDDCYNTSISNKQLPGSSEPKATIVSEFSKLNFSVFLQNYGNEHGGIDDFGEGFRDYGKLIWKIKLNSSGINIPTCKIKYQIKSQGILSDVVTSDTWLQTSNEDTPIQGIKVWLQDCGNKKVNVSIFDRPSGTGKGDGANDKWIDPVCDSTPGGKWIEGNQITGIKFRITENQCLTRF